MPRNTLKIVFTMELSKLYKSIYIIYFHVLGIKKEKRPKLFLKIHSGSHWCLIYL